MELDRRELDTWKPGGTSIEGVCPTSTHPFRSRCFPGSEEPGRGQLPTWEFLVGHLLSLSIFSGIDLG